MTTDSHDQLAAVHSLNEKAGLFLSTIQIVPENGREPGVDELEAEDLHVFVLNSQEFTDLQAYLAAAISLPESKEKFECRIPRDDFVSYVKDEGLYDVLKGYLPPIQQHCFDFKANTVGPMVNLGGEISNFAKQAARSYGQLHDYLSIIGDKNRTLEDPEVQEAIAISRRTLRVLQIDAKKKINACEPIIRKLTTFKLQTEKDKADLDYVHKRFEAAVPNKCWLRAILQELINKIGDALKAFLEEEVKPYGNEVDIRQQPRWYWKIPLLGRIFVWYNNSKLKKLMEMIQIRMQQYGKMCDDGDRKKLQLKESLEEVWGIRDAVENAARAIDKAISALAKMQGAFSSLTTDLAKISDLIEHLESDISEDFVKDRIVGLEDLQNAKVTWEKVDELAKLFQMNGVVRNIEEPPPPPY